MILTGSESKMKEKISHGLQFLYRTANSEDSDLRK